MNHIEYEGMIHNFVGMDRLFDEEGLAAINPHWINGSGFIGSFSKRLNSAQRHQQLPGVIGTHDPVALVGDWR